MAKGNNSGKKIPKSVIFKHFLSLPEEQRVKLLQSHVSPQLQNELAESEFRSTLNDLKKKPEAEIRAFLTNDKNFGGPWRDLIPYGERLAAGHKDSIYSQFGGIKRISDEDRFYALVTDKTTMPNRLVIFWGGVKGEVREDYEKKALGTLKDMKAMAAYLEDSRNYAPGTTEGDFLEAVKKTMDLSNEKSMMDHIREGAPEGDPDREEKIQRAAQLFMFQPESRVDHEALVKKLQGKDWKKIVDPKKALKDAHQGGWIKLEEVIPRIQSAMEIPETEEEKALFKEAAIQSAKDIYMSFSEETRKSAEGKKILNYTKVLQAELTTSCLKQPKVKDLRESLAGEFRTLEKEKSGWFLSKTNTNEYDVMMKGLRLFYAKLDLMNGQQPKGLSEEELKTVQSTDAEKLLADAKAGVYNYGCLKTANGKKGFLHDAGEERFDSSMKTFAGLNELGKKLHLGDPAAAVRDEAQQQLLQNRRDKNWLKENVADLAAKTICAQAMLGKGIPVYQQRAMIEGDAFLKQVEKIKADESFRHMMKQVGEEGVADAMIKGVSGLAEVDMKSRNAVRGGNAAEISEKDLTPVAKTQGLTSPIR